MSDKELNDVEPNSFPLPNEMKDRDWITPTRAGKIVPIEFAEEFEKFILERPEVLSKNEYDIGSLDDRFNIKFDMPTGDAKPIHNRGYQMNGIRQAQIRSALDKLEMEGVIERGTSPWSNPVFLVAKGDGRIRLTTDYRQLNKLVELERFPLRNIPNLLQELAGHNRYSLLDLTQGYHAVHTTNRKQVHIPGGHETNHAKCSSLPASPNGTTTVPFNTP